MNNTKKLVVSAILLAWILVLGMTQLGFIPFGPIRATTLHIPVIIGAILYGPYVGTFLGLSFGLYSLWTNYTKPTVLSFAFQNPLISVLPRIIFPLIAYFLYKALKEKSHKQMIRITSIISSVLLIEIIYSLVKAFKDGKTLGIVIGLISLVLIVMIWIMTIKKENIITPGFVSAVIATICHTAMVMGSIYLIYSDKMMGIKNMDRKGVLYYILSVVFLNGIPEAIIAGLITGGILSRKQS
uniref:ECF transporter S component n=1 Tax=Ezakiella massiliensis TaxID=1852374 RepID=UPI00094ED747|nr:ECF transporter S component [Ezakiella massiliensis]